MLPPKHLQLQVAGRELVIRLFKHHLHRKERGEMGDGVGEGQESRVEALGSHWRQPPTHLLMHHVRAGCAA